MGTALEKALALILSCDRELIDILSVTAQMSVQSTIIALLIGVPIGVWLGAVGCQPDTHGHAACCLWVNVLYALFWRGAVPPSPASVHS